MTNPATNFYALTALTITAPSGWTVQDCDTGSFFQTCGNSATTAQFSVGGGTAIAPGSSDVVYVEVLAPAPTSPATYPYTGTFTSSVQDASNLAFYAGPSFQLEAIDPLTAYTFTTQPPTQFIAGSAPVTVTVTQTAATTAEAGLVIDWGIIIIHGYAPGSYSLTATSVTTVSGGVASASATFKPSNNAPLVNPDQAEITATVGTSSITATSTAVTTIPGAPAQVAFLTGGTTAFPSTYYISGANGANNFGLPTYTGATQSAEIASAVQVGVAVSDHFGNPLPFSTAGLVVSTISVQALSGAGGWDHGGTALLNTVSCASPAGAVSCSGGTEGQITLNYFQSYTYATIGKIQATITGTYPTPSTPYTVGGSSGNIFTSTEAVALTAGPIAPANVAAGSAVKVYGNLTGSTQPGVPMTLGLCLSGGAACTGETAGYGGVNSGFGGAGGPQVFGGNSALGKTSTTSSFQASYYVDTTATHVGSFNATALDPDNASPTNTLTWATSQLVTTIAGTASTLTIVYYYLSTTPGPSAHPTGANIVAGLIVYPDATLADKYGNVVTNTSPFSAQIQLTATASAGPAGTLSATTVYINSGGSDTFSSFGAIAYYTPSGAAYGTVLTLTASGVVAGNAVSGFVTLTTVSPIPTFSITSPTGQLNGVLYTQNAATVFRGWANVSTGYDALAPTNIVSIGYKVNTHSYYATFTSQPDVNFAIAAFLSNGLNTIQFNATDTNGKTYTSQVYNVLVDNSLPVIKFSKTISIPFGVTLPVTIYDTEGDLNTSAVTAYYGNHNLNLTSANIVGTNTLGANSTFTLNLNGIPTGTWTLKVTATDYAGNSVVATETLTVTVSFADSVQYVANSASFTTEGAYKGVLASFTNAWSSTQSLVIFVQYTNSSGSWVYAGSTSIASGATAQVFVPITVPHLSSGTYTLTMFAVTTANLPVSVSTTITGFAVS